jgi:DUF3060 family protein
MMRAQNHNGIARVSGALLAASLALIVVGCAEHASAEDLNQPAITISTNSNINTFDCKGRPVRIGGNSNLVTILGKCPSLSIGGNSNLVQVESAELISVGGNSNILKYVRGVSKAEPEIQNGGNANIIAKVPAVSSANPSISIVTDGAGSNSKIELNNGLSPAINTNVSNTSGTTGPTQSRVHIGLDGIHIQSTDGGSKVDLTAP